VKTDLNQAFKPMVPGQPQIIDGSILPDGESPGSGANHPFPPAPPSLLNSANAPRLIPNQHVSPTPPKQNTAVPFPSPHPAILTPGQQRGAPMALFAIPPVGPSGQQRSISMLSLEARDRILVNSLIDQHLINKSSLTKMVNHLSLSPQAQTLLFLLLLFHHLINLWVLLKVNITKTARKILALVVFLPHISLLLHQIKAAQP
jgi:hypothetical protein